MIATQTIELDRFGSISINDSSRTFHLELYEQKIEGTLFTKRVRGKRIIDKTYYFSQLLDYKKITEHQKNWATPAGEKIGGRREFHDFQLSIEIYLDDPSQNYILMDFGMYVGIGGSHLTTDEYKHAQEQLGKLAAAFEKIKLQKNLPQSGPATSNELQTSRGTPTNYHVILEKTNTKTKYSQLSKLIKAKNPDIGFFKLQGILHSSGVTIFTTMIREEAEEYAAQIAATGAEVSVKSEILNYNSNSYRINSNSYTSIKNSYIPPIPTVLPSSSNSTTLPPVPPASCQPAPCNTPQKKSPCGCLVAAFVIFLIIGITGNIVNRTNEKEAEQEQSSTEQEQKEQNTPNASAPEESNSIVIGQEIKKLEMPEHRQKESPDTTPEPETEANATKDSSTSTQSTPSKKATIAPDALNILPTQKGKGYDKTIARYGVARIKKINKLLPIVAERAATQECMDHIYWVDVADNKSTSDMLVFYADAENGMRVYITEFLDVIEIRKVR